MAFNVARAPSSQTDGNHFLKRLSVYVPHDCVGAVIGFKGQFVRNLQVFTKTDIMVDQDDYLHFSDKACPAVKEEVDEKKDQSKAPEADAKNIEEFGSNVARDAIESALTVAAGNLNVNSQNERPSNARQQHKITRCVNIEGSDDSILKALFWIFQRVAETQGNYIYNVKLNVEFKIHDRIVGHIIGKGGSSIQQLKRISNGCDCHVTSKKDGTDATVCLYGGFGSCLIVICRINEMRRLTCDGTKRLAYPHRDRQVNSSNHGEHGMSNRGGPLMSIHATN